MTKQKWLKITTHEMIRNGTWCYKDETFYICLENGIVGYDGDNFIFSNKFLEGSTKKRKAKNKLKFILGMDIKLDDFYSEISDSKFSFLIDEFYGLRSPASPKPYQALIETIAQQQVNFEFAMKTIESLVMISGDKVEETIKNKKIKLYKFPNEIKIAKIGEKIKDAKLGYRYKYILNLTEKILNGELNLKKVEKMSESDAIDYMTKFKGIGRWSAELFLNYAFRKNTYPASDLGIRRGISRIFNLRLKDVKDKDVREIIDPFGKWKSLLAFYIVCYDRKVQNKKQQKTK